ncbi:hypothetical protein CALCODRAFT_469090 [Calocera cornea HHB12733]|uniref:BRCT domain-containing protein n=1 Tax=Calocera cornea HHB12733 TaxID=1353952 RepID=A0A165GCW7_9BASI|nr:hypothetical protein CALCODRAFT_469090 [Calocera cornea HHB12733]
MRRGHGSTKVPNVKLRPPPLKEKVKRRAVEDDDSMDVDEGPSRPSAYKDYSKGAKPFANVILCSTGIKDKVTLFKRATELGAVCQHDLTSDITHLVATETGSAKYNCAIENGMMVMLPEWVDETYKLWLAGEDIDFGESVRLYRLPFLSGFNICLTGDIDADERRETSRLMGVHGGVYSSSLTKQCTHLLVSGHSYDAVKTTEKVKFALRVNKEGKARMHVLWLEWLSDCIAVSGKLDENSYRIELDRPQPRVPPVTHHQLTPLNSTSSTSTSQTALPRPPPPAITVDVSKDLPELGFAPSMSQLQRNNQQLALWQQLRQANLPGSSQSNSQKKRSKIFIDLPPLDEVMNAAPSPIDLCGAPAIRLTTPIVDESKSILSRLALSKASSFNHTLDSASKLRAAPFNHPAVEVGPSTQTPQRKKAIFEGMTFCLIGDAKTAVLEGAIQSSGGIVLNRDSQSSEEGDDPAWFIVRLNTGARHLPKGTSSRNLAKYVTECWVEECLHEERVCDPGEHVTFRPILVSTPIPHLRQLRLHISGLEEGNSLYTQRLARTLGAQVAVVFSKKSTTHLICAAPSGVKYDHAVQWGIPTLRPDWLYDMARTGCIPEVSRYDVSVTPPARPIVGVTNHVLTVSAPALTLPVLPSPPQENVQPPTVGAPPALQAPSSNPRSRVSQRGSPSSPVIRLRFSKSPNKTSTSSTPTEALSHLAAALGEKRKSSEPDVEEKALPAKKRTRPVTRVKSGDISGPSTSTGKTTFAPLQAYNFDESVIAAADTSGEVSFEAPLGESMRVTYEDPESRAEKRKLMKLIGALPESVDPAAALETLDSPVVGARQPRPRPLNRRITRQS